MRVWLTAAFLALLAAGGRAETFDLHKYGKVEFFPVGDWNIRGDDVGEYKIQFTPKNPDVNAAGVLVIALGGADEFPTREKLAEQAMAAGRRMIEAGNFVETEPTLKPFYSKQGFGYYFLLTDPKLVGRPSVAGDYKQICLGLIRVNSDLLIRLQIFSDGETTEPFQQLVGMIEGMELTTK